MGEEEKAPVRLASDVLSMAAEVLHLKSEAGEKTGTRGGPLLVVGRLYISLTLILAVVTSASAYLDTTKTPSCSVQTMRVAVVACVISGLLLGVILIAVLYRKNAMFLFSPTELSTAAQEALLAPQTKETSTKGEPPKTAPAAAAAEPPTPPTKDQGKK